MDNSSQWPQGFGVVKAADHPSSSGSIDQQQQKRTLARPQQKDQAVNCPRCNSVNTKFCYYNNYSLSQPRYFCKTCRRYWTAGGSLRNVPVGGGSRKNRRSSSSAASTTSSSSVLTAAAAQAVANNLSSTSSVILHQGHDLNLSFPPHPTTHDDHGLHRHHQQYPINPNLTFSTTKPANFSIDHQLSNSKLLSHHHLPNTNNSTNNNMTPLLPPMGLFKNSLAGNNESREMMSSFMNPTSISSSASIFSSSGFPPNHQDQFKPSSLNFSLDGFSGGGGGGSDDGYASSLQLGVQQNIIDHGNASSGGARLLFPFNQENVNKEQVPPNVAAAASSHVDHQFDHPHNRSSSSSVQGGGVDGSISAGFWTGMLSGGSW